MRCGEDIYNTVPLYHYPETDLYCASLQVGKTSFLQRVTGVAFNRKNKYKPSLDDTATKYCVEVVSSAGNVLFNLFDWAWEEKRREVGDINQQLMRGKDGVVFMYDVTDRRSKTAFVDFSDWYQRAAGFDKPCLIVSTKNDQKKHVLTEDDGKRLARDGARRAFVPVNLVDDVGVDDAVLALTRIMMDDLNLTMSSFGPASAAALAWSDARAADTMSHLGMALGDLPSEKTKRVLLVALNSAIASKFSETFTLSEYVLESVGNADMCIAEIDTPEDPAALPVAAIIAPPTASDGQKAALMDIAKTRNIAFVVSVPRNALDGVSAAISP